MDSKSAFPTSTSKSSHLVNRINSIGFEERERTGFTLARQLVEFLTVPCNRGGSLTIFENGYSSLSSLRQFRSDLSWPDSTFTQRLPLRLRTKRTKKELFELQTLISLHKKWSNCFLECRLGQ